MKKGKLDKSVMNQAIQWVGMIDNKYEEGRKEKTSRFSIEWGKWSRKFNLKLKKMTDENKDANKVILKYVFLYWVNRSQLLEAYFKTMFGKRSLKRKLKREGEDLKELISKGKTTLVITEDELLNRVLGQ